MGTPTRSPSDLEKTLTKSEERTHVTQINQMHCSELADTPRGKSSTSVLSKDKRQTKKPHRDCNLTSARQMSPECCPIVNEGHFVEMSEVHQVPDVAGQLPPD